MEFDLTVSLPREVRYAATARLIAAEAARECGSAGAPAESFAAQVETAAHGSLQQPAGPHVVMAVHRHSHELVVTIDQHTMTLAI